MRRVVAFVFALGSVGFLAGPSATAGASAAPGRYIVVLKDSVSDPGAVAREHARRDGAAVSHVYRNALKGYAATIPAHRVDDVRSDPRVAYVEADQIATISGKTGGGTAPSQTIPPGITAVGAASSSTRAGDGAGVVAADVWVIDTGVDVTHPDLNVVGFDNFVGGPERDCNGHGTHVAGTAAARDNTSYVVGVAPGARVHAIKVLGCNGSGSYSAVIAGVDHVTANARPGAVANMSLGGPISTALDSAVRASAADGVLYVLAAGNSSTDACTTSPANTGRGTNGIITVGAVTDSKTAASFSNFGPCVDLWAPGVGVLSTWPGSTTKSLSGTSMAAPHVAGGGALLRSGNSGLTPTQAEADLKNNALPNGGRPFLSVGAY